MSWNFRMYIERDNGEKLYNDLDIGYTYNVSPMYYRALPLRDGIKTIDGMSGEEAETPIYIGLLELLSEPEEYKHLNPENGWGDYEGAIDVLLKLLHYSRDYPDMYFEVS